MRRSSKRASSASVLCASAAATDRYVLRGGGAETWEPRFTFHGFRYAEVDGWPADLDPAAIRAVVCHSDLERTGWFECSEPLVNRLHENVVWSMRGNFIDLPTDCPQRDERLGWTGDIAAARAHLRGCGSRA
jgi:alpha-L-rhamnosidase